MIHIFSTRENDYEPLQSLPDHSASVTAVEFTGGPGGLQLLSCGADKSVIYHTLKRDEVRTLLIIIYNVFVPLC